MKKTIIAISVGVFLVFYTIIPTIKDIRQEYKRDQFVTDSLERADSIRKVFVKDSLRVADSITQVNIKKAKFINDGHWVKGYRRKNGTYVAGHYRR